MAHARCRQFEPGDAVTLLVTSRCQGGQKRFETGERRAELAARIDLVASVFAIDVCASAVVDNHWHGGLRTRPDIAQRLSPAEIARRWLTVHPMRAWRRERGIDIDSSPSDEEIAQWLIDRERDDANLRGGERGHGLARAPRDRGPMSEFALEDARIRICDVSWFMRSTNEPIAREFNRRDGRSGAVFSRFHSSEIGDSGGELAAAIYTDLNEWRAGMVALPEDTLHGSLPKRIAAVRAGVDSGLPMIGAYTDAQYLAILDAVARFERFGRVPGSNRVQKKAKKARRVLPADTPAIFDRLGSADVAEADARFQELVMRIMRDAVEDRDALERLAIALADESHESVNELQATRDDERDAAGHDTARDEEIEWSGIDATVRTPASRRLKLGAGVDQAIAALGSAWRAAAHRDRRAQLSGSDRRLFDLRADILAALTTQAGLRETHSAIGGVDALERIAKRRGQAWVVCAMHRGRRATQRRVANWMQRRGIRARAMRPGALDAATIDPPSRE